MLVIRQSKSYIRPITDSDPIGHQWLRDQPGSRLCGRGVLVMHTANRFLTLLSPADRALFESDLRVVEMAHGQVLAEPHQPIETMYFPHRGIVSYVVSMSEGNMIETAMVGRDGMMGGLQALDEKISPNKIMVQVPGRASVVDVEIVRRAVDASPSLRVMLAKHEQF